MDPVLAPRNMRRAVSNPIRFYLVLLSFSSKTPTRTMLHYTNNKTDLRNVSHTCPIILSFLSSRCIGHANSIFRFAYDAENRYIHAYSAREEIGSFVPVFLSFCAFRFVYV